MQAGGTGFKSPRFHGSAGEAANLAGFAHRPVHELPRLRKCVARPGLGPGLGSSGGGDVLAVASPPRTERSHSGLVLHLGKVVDLRVTWVRIPLAPRQTAEQPNHGRGGTVGWRVSHPAQPRRRTGRVWCSGVPEAVRRLGSTKRPNPPSTAPTGSAGGARPSCSAGRGDHTFNVGTTRVRVPSWSRPRTPGCESHDLVAPRRSSPTGRGTRSRA